VSVPPTGLCPTWAIIRDYYDLEAKLHPRVAAGVRIWHNCVQIASARVQSPVPPAAHRSICSAIVRASSTSIPRYCIRRWRRHLSASDHRDEVRLDEVLRDDNVIHGPRHHCLRGQTLCSRTGQYVKAISLVALLLARPRRNVSYHSVEEGEIRSLDTRKMGSIWRKRAIRIDRGSDPSVALPPTENATETAVAPRQMPRSYSIRIDNSTSSANGTDI